MSLRFTSQLMIDNLPDEQFTDQFEVIMPALALDGDEDRSCLSSLTGMVYRPIVEEITFGFMNFATYPFSVIFDFSDNIFTSRLSISSEFFNIVLT